jgi:hypothetical protein
MNPIVVATDARERESEVGAMESASRVGKSTATADRSVKCVFCRDPILLADAMRNAGVCRLCASEIEEFGWRTIYDRDQNVGQIPANLRAAYKL